MGVSDPRENHERFERAVNAGDVDALVAPDQPQAVYVAGRGQQVVGRKAGRGALAAWLAVKSKLRLELTGASRSRATSRSSSTASSRATDPGCEEMRGEAGRVVEGVATASRGARFRSDTH